MTVTLTVGWSGYIQQLLNYSDTHCGWSVYIKEPLNDSDTHCGWSVYIKEPLNDSDTHCRVVWLHPTASELQ